MSAIGDVSNPLLVKEDVVPARKSDVTSCGGEGNNQKKRGETRNERRELVAGRRAKSEERTTEEETIQHKLKNMNECGQSPADRPQP